MNCEKANELMMEIIDNKISKDEYLLFEKHLEQCENCKKDFLMYQQILEEFNEIEILEAPENFEQNIMEKIENIEPEYRKSNKKINIFYWCISLIASFLLGVNIFSDSIIGKFNILSIKCGINNFNDIFKNIFSFINNTFYYFQENFIAFIINFKLIFPILIICLIIFKNKIKF